MIIVSNRAVGLLATLRRAPIFYASNPGLRRYRGLPWAIILPPRRLAGLIIKGLVLAARRGVDAVIDSQAPPTGGAKDQ